MIRRRDEDLALSGRRAAGPAADVEPASNGDPSGEPDAARRPPASIVGRPAPDTGGVGEAEDITPGVRPGQTSG